MEDRYLDEQIATMFNVQQLHYSTSMDAIWWLIEKMISCTKVVTITDDDNMAAHCKITVFPNGLGDEKQLVFSHWAETMPLAMCGAIVEYYNWMRDYDE